MEEKDKVKRKTRWKYTREERNRCRNRKRVEGGRRRGQKRRKKGIWKILEEDDLEEKEKVKRKRRGN